MLYYYNDISKEKNVNKVRIGIIGFGGMGSSHAGYLVKGEVRNAELVAACDINPARLDVAKSMSPDHSGFRQPGGALRRQVR